MVCIKGSKNYPCFHLGCPTCRERRITRNYASPNYIPLPRINGPRFANRPFRNQHHPQHSSASSFWTHSGPEVSNIFSTPIFPELGFKQTFLIQSGFIRSYSFIAKQPKPFSSANTSFLSLPDLTHFSLRTTQAVPYLPGSHLEDKVPSFHLRHHSDISPSSLWTPERFFSSSGHWFQHGPFTFTTHYAFGNGCRLHFTVKINNHGSLLSPYSLERPSIKSITIEVENPRQQTQFCQESREDLPFSADCRLQVRLYCSTSHLHSLKLSFKPENQNQNYSGPSVFPQQTRVETPLPALEDSDSIDSADEIKSEPKNLWIDPSAFPLTQDYHLGPRTVPIHIHLPCPVCDEPGKERGKSTFSTKTTEKTEPTPGFKKEAPAPPSTISDDTEPEVEVHSEEKLAKWIREVYWNLPALPSKTEEKTANLSAEIKNQDKSSENSEQKIFDPVTNNEEAEINSWFRRSLLLLRQKGFDVSCLNKELDVLVKELEQTKIKSKNQTSICSDPAVTTPSPRDFLMKKGYNYFFQNKNNQLGFAQCFDDNILFYVFPESGFCEIYHHRFPTEFQGKIETELLFRKAGSPFVYKNVAIFSPVLIDSLDLDHITNQPFTPWSPFSFFTFHLPDHCPLRSLSVSGDARIFLPGIEGNQSRHFSCSPFEFHTDLFTNFIEQLDIICTEPVLSKYLHFLVHRTHLGLQSHPPGFRPMPQHLPSQTAAA